MRALLAYDRSAGAEQAAALVEGIHWPPGSAVRIVSVIEPLLMPMPGQPFNPVDLVGSEEIEREVMTDHQGEVDRLVRRLTTGAVAGEGVVKRGRPATVIAQEAADFSADLLIVGSRGLGRIKSLVLGSVSGELVDHAVCPVLVARGSAHGRVLFATDGSMAAGAAEGLLASWPIFDDAVIRVVSVADVMSPWHTGIAPTMYQQAMEAYSKDLAHAGAEHHAVAEAAADRLRAAGRNVEIAVPVGDPAPAILDEAEAWQTDLIVLGSRGHTGLSRLLLGSVARNVLMGSHASVLIARGSRAKQPE